MVRAVTRRCTPDVPFRFPRSRPPRRRRGGDTETPGQRDARWWTGVDDVHRFEHRELGQIPDEVIDTEDQVGGAGFLTDLAVHEGPQRQIFGIQLVRGGQRRAGWIEALAAFARRPLTPGVPTGIPARKRRWTPCVRQCVSQRRQRISGSGPAARSRRRVRPPNRSSSIRAECGCRRSARPRCPVS